MSSLSNSISDLHSLRKQLDAIDSELVSVLAKRMSFSVQAAQFKSSASAICDKQRESEILKSAKEKALDLGLNHGLTLEIFSSILNFSRTAVLNEFKNIELRKNGK